MTRHRFAFDPAYRVPALLFGVVPRTAHVDLDADGLRVRFGPWRLAAGLDLVDDVTLSSDFAFLKTAGPPHLSFSDRGVTFATNGRRAVCVSFLTPVAGIDPTRLVRHPGATLTVEDPDAFAAELRSLLAARAR